MVRVALICLLMQGCALALPLAGAGSAVRSEVRVQKIEKRILELEQIMDYLIEKNVK